MAKAILMSIRPKHVCNILNLIKLLEIRKKFPSDYVGWVYIYCTKGGDMICYRPNFDGYACVPNLYGNEYFNGKVVARFWCDKVDLIRVRFNAYCGGELSQDGLCKYACLSLEELDNYLLGGEGYAIHITKLEIFDKPKDISEFHKKHFPQFAGFVKNTTYYGLMPITRAPQSWSWIEV